MTKDVWLRIGARKKYTRWEISTASIFVKTKPTCKANELVLKLTIDVPDELFEEPIYNLKVTLPKPPPKHIEAAELSKEVSKVMSERMGIKVKVGIDAPAGKPFSESLRDL